MACKFVIKNLFNLPGDLSVLACEGDGVGLADLGGRVGRIQKDGELRQSVVFSGERKMLNQTRRKTSRAFETFEKIRLTVEEARSSTWIVFID